MTETETLMDQIRRLLDGVLLPRDFVVEYRDRYADTHGADPIELWEAFEDLAYSATDFVEADELRGPDDIDTPSLMSRAQQTYDIATDIIRRRGLHNIR